MSANLYDLIRTAAPDPDTLCIETPTGCRFRYRDVDEGSARLANVLRAHAVGPGDRIAAQVAKSPQAVLLYLACLRVGAAYLPLNTAYTLSELAYFVGDAEPRVIVSAPEAAEEIAALPEVADVTVLTLDGAGGGSLMAAAAEAPTDSATVPREADDLAAIVYTSGTTGRSKGAMITHGNLASNAITLRESWGFSAADILLHALPIYHVHGLFVALNTILLAGARLYFMPRFDADIIIRELPNVTAMMGVPTFYTRLLARPDFTADICRNVRVFISGSAPLLAETFTSFEERTGHRILERYGMTETGMNASNPLDGARRPGTVGPALPGISLRVTDEAGQVLGPDTAGMLEIRGPNVFKGYWRMPDKTAESFRDDGYFISGDVARIAADGYVSIVGRDKDMIISGGFNVYPKEIETVIDAIGGVAESAVIGVPHPDFGEGVVAVICPSDPAAPPDPDRVIATARESLAAYKVPKQVVFVEALPRNTMGKVQKNILRENYRDGFRS